MDQRRGLQFSVLPLDVNWKYRYNMVRGVLVDGCWIEEPCRVKEEIRHFFKRRLNWRGLD